MKKGKIRTLFLAMALMLGVGAVGTGYHYVANNESVLKNVYADNVTGALTFSSNSTKINSASVNATDTQSNSWIITTVGTTSFTPTTSYCQVGSSKSPATSITFTTTLDQEQTITNFFAKFGGFSGTAGTVTLKVGDTTVGTGNLDGTNDVTITNTSSVTGTVLTITVTGISKGVKCYNLSYTYASNSYLTISGAKTTNVGDNCSLTATATGFNITNPIVWSIDDTELATITSDGLNATLSALKAGTVKVTVSTTDTSGNEIKKTISILLVNHGTKDSPLSVSDAAALITSTTKSSDKLYVTGYVYSSVSSEVNNQTVYTLVIKDTADSDISITVYQADLDSGITENTPSAGDTVTVSGYYMVYNSVMEITSSGSDYAMILSLEKGKAVEDSTNYGTASSPLTVEEAIALCTSTTTSAKELYVKGIITSSPSVNASTKRYSSFTIKTTESSTSELTIYNSTLDSTLTTNNISLEIGDTIVAHGYYVNYKGTTPELTNVSTNYPTIVSDAKEAFSSIATKFANIEPMANMKLSYSENDDNTYSDFTNICIQFTYTSDLVTRSVVKANGLFVSFDENVKTDNSLFNTKGTIKTNSTGNNQYTFAVNNIPLTSANTTFYVAAYILDANGNYAYSQVKEYSVSSMIDTYQAMDSSVVSDDTKTLLNSLETAITAANENTGD